jgi:hypothetical protein
MTLSELATPGESMKERVALFASDTCTLTSFTTLNNPISTASSTGARKSKVIIPPSSFALGWAFPPVCCTIRTFPKSAAKPGVPNPVPSTGAEVLNKRA